MDIRRSPRNTCIARFPFNNTNYDIMSEMPGFSKWEGRAIIFRPSPANVEYLLKHFPDAIWLEGTDEYVRELTKRNALSAEIRAGKLSLDIDDDHEYKLKPWAHQRTAFLLSRDKEAFALLMEQRTGKTKVIIDTAAYLFKRRRLTNLVIVSVNGVHRNWIDNEIPKHIPDWCKYEAYFHRTNPNKKQMANFERVLESSGKLRIFAFHFEGFGSIKTQEMFEAAIGPRVHRGVLTMIAADESTRIKNRSSFRTKYLTRAGQRVEFRRILTGTPIVKDPTDIYGQYYFLDPALLGYDTESSFKKHFCKIKTFVKDSEGNFKLAGPNDAYTGGARFEKFEGVKNAEELSNLIDGTSYRVLREDCMDVPAKVYKRRPVEMTAEQKRLYRELLEEYIAEFEGATVTAALAMVRAIRLQQVLCNWWPMEETKMEGQENWKNVRAISKINPRLEAIKEIVASTEDKVIIYAAFRPDLALIQETFGTRAVSYHGGIKDDQKAKNYWRFQNDPKAEIMVANPSAAIGVEWSEAGTMIYHSNRFNLEHRLQSEDRAEKDGKKIGTTIYDLETPGTQDTKIISNLKGKKNIADIITKDPKRYFMETLEDFKKETM